MKFFIALTLAISALAAAVPAAIEKRQTSDDYVQGGCKAVVLIYARASTEPGNVGSLGPSLKSGLQAKYPNNFALQGVEYPADLASNFLPGGSGADSINEMTRLITDVATRCPTAKIAVGGYSQGTAVAARGIAQLSTALKARVGAVILFGYTQNAQLNGGVPGISQDRVKVYCAVGDLVCFGTLTITPAHFTYAADVPSAVSFVASTLGSV